MVFFAISPVFSEVHFVWRKKKDKVSAEILTVWVCHAPFQGKKEKVHLQKYSSIYSNSSAPSFLLFYTPDSHVKSFTGIFSCGACGYTWWLDKWGSALANVHCFPQLTYGICYKMQRKAINLPSAAEISTLPKTLLLSAPLTMTLKEERGVIFSVADILLHSLAVSSQPYVNWFWILI